MSVIAGKIRFLSRFLTCPREVGSITPSSGFLVNAICKTVFWNRVELVVELGAGTGVVTAEIARNLKPGAKAVIFEKDAVFSRQLKRDFPLFTHCRDAMRLTEELETHGIREADCIISCLPMANFSTEQRVELLDHVKKVLKPDGMFVQYQYSLQMKKTLKSRFKVVHTHFVPLNLPPAFVHVCQD
ncbi:class I SAM-dependent methyltransferase [Staphylospora marina]|uniref:class I SAM-dependent methyltransferase n=1 Tax=Staphylospora marina TaxID=2490858 RepID=UPI000F5BC518|nr:methyltransferase domain-containing protein [Staphylospora marina]